MPDTVNSQDGLPVILGSAPMTTAASKGQPALDENTIEHADSLREDYPMLSPMGKLPRSIINLYGFVLLGWAAVKFHKDSFQKSFYVNDSPRASLGYIALFGVLAVLFDAFTDPGMANYSDNCRFASGRRRPFVLAGGILTVVVYGLGWLPLVPPGAASSMWYGIFHVGAQLVETLLIIPLDGWAADMTPTSEDRSRLFASREVFTVVGILLGAVVPGFLSFHVSLSFIFGLLTLLGAVLLFWYGKERPTSRLPAPSKDTWSDTGIMPTLLSTWYNVPFRFLLLSESAEAFGTAVPFVILPFFTQAVLGEECVDSDIAFSILAGFHLITRLACVPIWVAVAKRIGKFRTLVYFNFMLAAAYLLFVFIGRDSGNCGMFGLSAVLSAIWGGVFAGSIFLRSVLADVVDYDEFLTGRRRESQYFMTLGFIPKFILVPAEAIPIMLMAAFGFVRSSEEDPSPEQPQAVRLLLSMCFSVVPAVFILFGAIALCWYPQAARTEQAHHEVIDAIRHKHNKGLTAEDPWAPGRMLPPPPPHGPHHGILSYFFASELLHAVGGKAEVFMWSRQGSRRDQHSGNVDYRSLILSPSKYVVAAPILAIPGAFVLVRGFDDLNDDLGASSSPIGLILLGVALLMCWFHGTRIRAARRVRELQIPKADIVLQYNYLCRFTGDSPLPIAQEKPIEEPTVTSIAQSRVATVVVNAGKNRSIPLQSSEARSST